MTGRLVYAPTVMTADLPWDIHAFKQEDEAFPHHSTLDQLFTGPEVRGIPRARPLAAASAIEAMNAGNSSNRNEPINSPAEEWTRRGLLRWVSALVTVARQ